MRGDDNSLPCQKWSFVGAKKSLSIRSRGVRKLRTDPAHPHYPSIDSNRCLRSSNSVSRTGSVRVSAVSHLQIILTPPKPANFSFSSSYLRLLRLSNQTRRVGPGRSRSPCGTMDAAFAHQNRTIFSYTWQCGWTLYNRFLEPCGLAHSRGARHLKARVRPPHLSSSYGRDLEL
jgi:hypothetical protein